MKRSSSSTKKPYLVQERTTAGKSSPMRSCINLIFFHSMSSRSASAARRSVWEDSVAMSWSSSGAKGGGSRAQGPECLLSEP